MDGERNRNRSMFPKTAAVLDHYRKLFGEDTKLLYAEENGLVIGKKFEDRVRDSKLGEEKQ
jgi:hypothetical protein